MGKAPDVKDKAPTPPAPKPPAVPSATAASPKIGLYGDVIVVDRPKFEELIVSLLHGYGQRYTPSALPSQMMPMFHLATRAEAVELLQALQKSKRERV